MSSASTTTSSPRPDGLRLIVGLAAAWTIVVLAVVLTTPALMSAPPCAGMVAPPPGCDTLNAAGNELVWTTQTRPIGLLALGGYGLIGIVGVALRRGLGR